MQRQAVQLHHSTLCSKPCATSSRFGARCFGALARPKYRSLARTSRYTRTRVADVEGPAVIVEDAPGALRKAMAGFGWDKAWVEGIMDRVARRELTTTASNMTQVVLYLESLGIPRLSICNMAAINPDILQRSVESELEPVVQYCKGRGVTGSSLVRLLELHPGLLSYSVGGPCLVKGRARAEVDVGQVRGKQLANVLYWREGASFGKSPVSPPKPRDGA